MEHWLDNDSYDKALGQARLQLGEIMSVFNMYGHDIFIKGAVEECIKVCEDFGMRVRGKDHPIGLKPHERVNPRGI